MSVHALRKLTTAGSQNAICFLRAKSLWKMSIKTASIYFRSAKAEIPFSPLFLPLKVSSIEIMNKPQALELVSNLLYIVIIPGPMGTRLHRPWHLYVEVDTFLLMVV